VNGSHETINHFARNFAKGSPIQNIVSPPNSMINVYQSNSSNLRCLAILLCNVSLITKHISNFPYFYDIHISQGSVVVEYLNMSLWQIYYHVCERKKMKIG